MTHDPITALQQRLDLLRQRVRDPDSPPPDRAQLWAAIAACKAELRACGVPADDRTEDGLGRNEATASQSGGAGDSTIGRIEAIEGLPAEDWAAPADEERSRLLGAWLAGSSISPLMSPARSRKATSVRRHRS